MIIPIQLLITLSYIPFSSWENHCMRDGKEVIEEDFDVLYGDPRRCPHHPHITTSSPDGMFDTPCNECECNSDRCEEW